MMLKDMTKNEALKRVAEVREFVAKERALIKERREEEADRGLFARTFAREEDMLDRLEGLVK